jgi:hypothetical protein
MNPKPELLQRIFGGIFWYPMPFVLLAAGLKYISWNTFFWYLLCDAIYLILLLAIGLTIELLMANSMKSSKTTFYHKLLFRYCQWKLLNYFVPKNDLLAFPL